MQLTIEQQNAILKSLLEYDVAFAHRTIPLKSHIPYISRVSGVELQKVAIFLAMLYDLDWKESVAEATAIPAKEVPVINIEKDAEGIITEEQHDDETAGAEQAEAHKMATRSRQASTTTVAPSRPTTRGSRSVSKRSSDEMASNTEGEITHGDDDDITTSGTVPSRSTSPIHDDSSSPPPKRSRRASRR